jgi:hypothetical protein
MKPVILIGSLLLSLGVVTTASAAPEVLTGVPGMVIWVFLGYCAIVVLAQLFAALAALRRILEEATTRKNPSKRIPLR